MQKPRTQTQLLEDFRKELEQVISKAKEFKELPEGELKRLPEGKAWSILHCFEHMNLYGTIYLEFFEEALDKAKARKGDPIYKSGWLGGWSARSMLPDEQQVKMPMKTFKKMDPAGQEVEVHVIDRFIAQHEQLRSLLDRAQSLELQRTKCRTTIPGLRFRLGDALAFFLNHNHRHIFQAQPIAQSI